jgi:hypothetical protein
VDLEELVGLVIAGADGHLGRRGVVDDAQAVASLEPPHRGRRRLRQELGTVGHDRGDVADLTDPEGGGRVLVHAIVVEWPARVPAAVAAPHHRVGIELHAPARDVRRARRVNPHQRRLADDAGVEQLLGLHDRRIVEEVLGDAERRAGARHGVGDALGLGQRDGQRLLTRHVLAGRERRDDLVRVQPGGREELDGVNRAVVQDFLEVRVHAGCNAPLARAALGPLRVRVAQGDHVTAGVLEVAGHVELRDVAATDDGEAHAIHGPGL